MPIITDYNERTTERLAEKFLTDALETLAISAAELGCICPNCGTLQQSLGAEIAEETAADEWDTSNSVVGQACEAMALGGRRELRRVARAAIKERDQPMLELLNAFIKRLRTLWPADTTTLDLPASLLPKQLAN